MALSKKAAAIRHGYPELPLAVGLARHHDVAEFDISVERARELPPETDRTAEVWPERLRAAKIRFASPADAYKDHIITVLTPIECAKRLDRDAALAAGRALLKGGNSGAFAFDVNGALQGRHFSRELCYATL